MRPGRPRCPRRIENEPVVSYFKPQGVPLKDLDFVLLSLEELEVVRLIDLENLNQEEAAQRMGISRRALWVDLQSARKKIVEALVSGKAIEIKGGDFVLKKSRTCSCGDCLTEWEILDAADEAPCCPNCGSIDIHYDRKSQEVDGRRRCCKGHCRQSNETDGRDA